MSMRISVNDPVAIYGECTACTYDQRLATHHQALVVRYRQGSGYREVLSPGRIVCLAGEGTQ
ncbi:hypothetical protein [Thiolapillus sp.]|uniref:hypothetical protein n=1 Tax=Thiolapillus sp. TaxID=2017437 RepID=UPI003AF73F19